MYILGISAYYHDSAACLLQDGEILAAAQEERFTRVKNDAAFPAQSIRYCLELAGITLSQVDHIAYYEKPFLKFERLLETHLAFAPMGIRAFLKAMPVWLKEKLYFKKMLTRALQQIDPDWKFNGKNLLFTEHHQAHAASSFYPSPFKEAVILTVDGVGEWTTTSVCLGDDNKIENKANINFPHSLGLLYSAFTYYLGFKVNCDEYKVMGLAPYGKPTYTKLIFEELVHVQPDGSFRLNMRYFTYAAGLTMTGKRFEKLFDQPARKSGAELTPFYMDMARSIQDVTGQIMLLLTQGLFKKYGGENLCLAGGVALNCVANGKILKQSGFKNIWIQPAAGDAGGALGAAYAVYFEYLNNARILPLGGADKMQNGLLGPSYDASVIEEALNKHQLPFEIWANDKLHETVASAMASGQIIGYFKGRMEFGPRALGARSILADPRNAEMQSALNLKIKFRESFRPFAPAVLEEHAGEYFDLHAPSPYMLLVAEVNAGKRLPVNDEADSLKKINQARSVIPAVTHLDYTARLQTVNANQHPDFYGLISAFYKLTGCPMVINTSFNRMDEPIVCTPEDAVMCFMNTEIDILVIENYVVIKQKR